METVIRKTLPSLYRSGSTQTVIDAVKSNDDVLFYWNLISQDIDEEKTSLELLGELLTCELLFKGFLWHRISNWKYTRLLQKRLQLKYWA